MEQSWGKMHFQGGQGRLRTAKGSIKGSEILVSSSFAECLLQVSHRGCNIEQGRMSAFRRLIV